MPCDHEAARRSRGINRTSFLAEQKCADYLDGLKGEGRKVKSA